MANQGLSQTAIAKALGVTRQAISKQMRRADFKGPSPRPKLKVDKVHCSGIGCVNWVKPKPTSSGHVFCSSQCYRRTIREKGVKNALYGGHQLPWLSIEKKLLHINNTCGGNGEVKQ